VKLGYNKVEPSPIAREISIVWQKVLRALWAEKTTQKHIADDLALPASEVNGLIFGMIAAPTAPPVFSGRSFAVVNNKIST
jgi:hypothetical protein